MLRRLFLRFAPMAVIAMPASALAGPPYVSDDPQPTDRGRFEIYLFNQHTATRDGGAGAYGIDFNYGAAPELQLTAVLPLAYERPAGAPHATAVGNVELAAKVRFIHGEDEGWNVALFPRVVLPSASRRVGEQHASVLLPLWLERDWGPWSTFGGGGCAIHRGDGDRDFCLVSWALARQILPALQLGVEAFHRTPDSRGARAATGFNVGIHYDLTPNFHVVASAGSGIQNAAATNRTSWYLALLMTY
jgi:hypothetical protein